MDREMIESTSPDRVRNNVMRHEYKVLNEKEKRQMQRVKDDGLAMWDFLDTLGGSREIALAKTNLEQSVMWAVKHITG
jgi:hypothetical protein